MWTKTSRLQLNKIGRKEEVWKFTPQEVLLSCGDSNTAQMALHSLARV
jgi:hypothetical protein